MKTTYMRKKNQLEPGIKRIICIFFLSIVLFSLAGCTLDKISAQQEKATGIWEELVGGLSFGQSFMATQDNLYRIDLSTATYSRENTAPVVFSLKSNPQDPTSIVTIEIAAAEIQNDRPTTVEFPPIPDSAGKSYYFSIASPTATPGNAITVYASDQDIYASGSAYKNNQAVNGDLAFTAYSHANFSFAGVMGDISSRAAQDVPFTAFFSVLILATCAGLGLTFRRKLKTQPGE